MLKAIELNCRNNFISSTSKSSNKKETFVDLPGAITCRGICLCRNVALMKDVQIPNAFQESITERLISWI